MLYAVRREDEIVRGRRNATEIARLGDVLATRRSSLIKIERIPVVDLTLPNRMITKVTIINSGGDCIHGNQARPPEYAARPPNL
jgi:hypothetical protein